MQYDLSSRLLAFSAGIVKLVLALPSNTAAKKIGGQLLRCATSAAANYEECRGAFTRADFCNRLQIARKEMRENCYWLKLVKLSGLAEPDETLRCLIDEATQLRAILGKSTVTARNQSPRANGKQQAAKLKA